MQLAGWPPSPSGDTWVLACPHAGNPPATLPCIHAIGVRQLLWAWRAGVRHIVLSQGHCVQCPTRGPHDFPSLLEQFNAALAARGVPGINSQPPARPDPAPPAHCGTGRRHFFRRLFGQVSAGVLPEKASPESPPPGTLLPEGHGPWPWVPHLGDACDGCGQCVRICAHQALRFDPDAAAYRVDAARCTGCRLCLDLCPREAITLRSWTAAEPRSIDVHRLACTRCGTPFHRRGHAGIAPLCPACAGGAVRRPDRVVVE